MVYSGTVAPPGGKLAARYSTWTADTRAAFYSSHPNRS